MTRANPDGDGSKHPEASPVTLNTLHVTNGDPVLYLWKKAALLGTHLAWRDALYEGPVLSDRSLEELSTIRAQFLASEGYGNPIKINRDFEKRDALLRRAADFDEVVLWFEHDVYDQLQLLQILAYLSAMDLSAGSVQLIQSENYLGMLSADELLALLPKRRSLTRASANVAQRAWHAFTAETPNDLHAMLDQDVAGFPFLRGALQRLCEEFPALKSGLSRTQQNIVEAIGQGARSPDDVFKRSQAREEAAFLSDAICLRKIAELSADPAPLVAELEGGLELTVLGRRVASGDADWLDAQPLDRWIGGVHLTSANHWRWDEAGRAFVERAA